MGFGTHPGAQSPITDDMWGRQQVHTWRLGEMGDVPETSTGDAGGLADTRGGDLGPSCTHVSEGQLGPAGDTRARGRTEVGES